MHNYPKSVFAAVELHVGDYAALCGCNTHLHVLHSYIHSPIGGTHGTLFFIIILFAAIRHTWRTNKIAFATSYHLRVC